MCKSAATTTSEDKKENVESNNYGQLQELRDALSQTVAYCPQEESITYPQRRMLPLEVARSATTVQTVPSAPTQSLWEKCSEQKPQTLTSPGT